MKNVEDLYSLTPMQETMLLHALTTARSDVLFSQFGYTLRGALDHSRFRRAWDAVLQRHPVLRSCFVWKGLQEPLQVVRREVTLPFELLDWRGASEAEKAERFERLRRDDAARGFELTDAPLMRVTCVQWTDQQVELLWSSHHLQLDRWCVGVVWSDVWRAYETGRLDPPDAVFLDYLKWQKRQDRPRAEAFWRTELAGLREATCLAAPQVASEGPETAECLLAAGDWTEVVAAARALRVTPSVLLQAAWAVTLARATGRDDVVFGATVSGRPPEISGVESIVGSLIGNLPVRATMGGDVRDWLQDLHRRQQRRASFEWLSTTDVQRCSALPDGPALFDTLVVWLAPVHDSTPTPVDVQPHDGSLETAYPVTLGVEEQDGALRITLRCTATLNDGLSASGLLARVRRVLTSWSKSTGDGWEGLLGRPLVDRPAPPDASDRANAGRPSVQHFDPGRVTERAGRRGEGFEILQESLREEWKALLGRPDFESGDHFFECGGTSLLAVQLHLRVEQLTGRSIPLFDLYRDATLEGMARTLADHQWPFQASFVRPIRDRGARVPLFCIASPEVNTIGYALVARHLDDETPVYVVQAPPESDEIKRMVPAELGNLASAYIDAVRDVAPQGPYRFLGMCGGSHLSLEMAKQLERDGHDVDFVGIVNTWGLFTLTWKFHLLKAVNRLRWYSRRVREVAASESGARWSTVWGVVRRRVRNLTGQANEAAAAESSAETPAQGTSSQGTLTAEEIERLWHDADWPPATLPPKFGGRVTVFRLAEQDWFRNNDFALGWGQHAQSVDVRPLSIVEHLDILREPFVREISREIDDCCASLDGARAEQARDPSRPGEALA